jgi:hypothetical protein
MMVRCFVLVLLVLSSGCATDTAGGGPTDRRGDGPPVVGGTTLRLLDAEEAAAFLGLEDDVTRAFSAFDRSFRLRTTSPVDDATYRAFAAGEARAFSEQERAGWKAAARVVDEVVAGLDLPLPEEVLLIKTTGDEELRAGAYTRRNAIILTAAGDERRKERFSAGLLAHELFHVASRHDPAFRERMYALLAFTPCAPPPLPPALEAVRLTNPDAHLQSFCGPATRKGVTHQVVPILTVGDSLEEALAAAEWFKALRIFLVPLGGEAPWPIAETDFTSRIARNTDYAIHPEEVLAVHLTMMVRPPETLADPAFMRRYQDALTPGR